MCHQVYFFAVLNAVEVVEREVDLRKQLVQLLVVVIFQTASKHVHVQLTLGVLCHRGNHDGKLVSQVLVTGERNVDRARAALVATQLDHVRLELLVNVWQIDCRLAQWRKSGAILLGEIDIRLNQLAPNRHDLGL